MQRASHVPPAVNARTTQFEWAASDEDLARPVTAVERDSVLVSERAAVLCRVAAVVARLAASDLSYRFWVQAQSQQRIVGSERRLL
jgi:hypothetical protein